MVQALLMHRYAYKGKWVIRVADAVDQQKTPRSVVETVVHKSRLCYFVSISCKHVYRCIGAGSVQQYMGTCTPQISGHGD